MEYRKVTLDFESHSIRALVSDGKATSWCVEDICDALKITDLISDVPIFSLCGSADRLWFGMDICWCIKASDIKNLLNPFKNDSATMKQLCKNMVRFVEGGYLEQIASTSMVTPSCTAASDIVYNGLTMTSLQVAEITQRQHKHVMESIRKMASAWEEEFGTPLKMSTYTDSTGRTFPCYILTKTECLFVVTKSKDNVRARLIKRWEELERQANHNTIVVPTTLKEALLLAYQQQEQIEQQNSTIGSLTENVMQMEPKAEYYDHAILNRTHFSTAAIAGELRMCYPVLVTKLKEAGIIEGGEGCRVRTVAPYTNWMEKIKVAGSTGAYWQWTKEGRDGVIRIINPNMPK